MNNNILFTLHVVRDGAVGWLALIESIHLAIFDTINAKVMTKLLTENIFQMDKITRRKEVGGTCFLAAITTTATVD